MRSIVDDLAPGDVLDRFEAELAPWLDATPFGVEDFAGRATRRTGALDGALPASRELLQHPLILDATAGLLEGATTFHVHLTQAIAIGGGEPAQPIHRDQWAFDFFPFPEGYDVQLNTIWALTDFTEANGATRVVPGSNRGDVDRLGAFDAADTVPAEMSRGLGARLQRQRPPRWRRQHAPTRSASASTSPTPRSWLRQEENQYLERAPRGRPHPRRRPPPPPRLRARRLRPRLRRRRPRPPRRRPGQGRLVPLRRGLTSSLPRTSGSLIERAFVTTVVSFAATRAVTPPS